MSHIHDPFLLPADITETKFIPIYTHKKCAGQKIRKWNNTSCWNVLIQDMKTEKMGKDDTLEKLLPDYTGAPYLCKDAGGNAPSFGFL